MRRLLACALALSPLFMAAAQAQPRPQIILYQEDNYRGQQLVVDGPIDRIKTLKFDDRVSSIHVISGTWLLCADDVYRGECITVRNDEPKLSRLGFDDKLSSLRPIQDDRGNGRRRRDDR